VFISQHRRLTTQQGHGVQYIPGHIEPFVDLIVQDYLPDEGEILDLGGGGLRFALPVAQTGRRIKVVDLDPSGVDLDLIVERVNANEGSSLESRHFAPLIEFHIGDGLEFLASAEDNFRLITAFRLVHLFDPETIEEFFRLTSKALVTDGHLAFSGMTAFNLPVGTESQLNEVFTGSEPIRGDQQLYRRFASNPEADEARGAHNLRAEIHLLDSEFVATTAQRHGFEMVVDAYRSTRIVAGFVLKKRPRT
jgi:spermidine synthase